MSLKTQSASSPSPSSGEYTVPCRSLQMLCQDTLLNSKYYAPLCSPQNREKASLPNYRRLHGGKGMATTDQCIKKKDECLDCDFTSDESNKEKELIWHNRGSKKKT